MKITKYGHACVLVEEGEAKILLDPGAFSKGFESLTDLTAILITHQHQDHLVPGHIKQLLRNNSDAQVLADEGSAGILNDAGVEARAVHEGDELTLAGVKVEVIGKDHAVIHASIPGIPDVGYMIADAFFYPGDAFTIPDRPVRVLAAPVAAPWLKIGEAVDYVREVQPKVAIPVHDAVLSEVGRGIHINALRELTKNAGVEVRVVEDGQSAEV
jgi:L-ascorbate metabolism protein UlaG (beta-lactamase superfamily)